MRPNLRDTITYWENWHWLIKYIPILPVWLWYSIRSRSHWFFTASNPNLIFGGFYGGSKLEMYRQLPRFTYPATIRASPSWRFRQIEKRMEDRKLTFPVAVKPDTGKMGLMFRKIENYDQLKVYHKTIGATYLIQEFIDYPIEVSVFYYRFANEQKGTITGFVKKEPLQISGDGISCVEQLIRNHPRASYLYHELCAKHKARLNQVLSKGNTFQLSDALNLSRGGKLVSLAHEKDEKLLSLFDDISRHSGFLFGRYDIRCRSVEDLKNRSNFSILEFNGCGAEPHHIYGNGNSLFTACSILIRHWQILYRISGQNFRTGAPTWSFKKGLKYLHRNRRYFQRLKQLDTQFDLPAATDRVDSIPVNCVA